MTRVPLVDIVRSAAGVGQDTTADESVDVLLTQLSNERRRLVISHLHHDIGAEEIVTTRELAEFVTHYECGDGYTSDDRKPIYVALYQSHLPKLVDAGILEQVDTHEFRPGPNLAAAAEILETAESVTGGEES